MSRYLAIIAAIALTTGCNRTEVDLGGATRKVMEVPPEPIEALDILFVIDTSASMAEEQQALIASAADSLFAQLAAEVGGMPDLHLGTVSTDLGAGPFNLTGCDAPGDDGMLQGVRASSLCSGISIDGDFVSDVDDGSGGRVTNYTGSLDEAFGCIAGLGTSGCGFEQPLEAMRRALDGRNPGFLRDQAMLLVLFLTDEDDCSAFDTGLFDTAQHSLTDPLGPLSSFRCFEFGVECAGDVPRAAGDKQDCSPRHDSLYVTSTSEFAAFLQGLKPDPTMVMVAGIFGDPAPVEVVASSGGQEVSLADICDDEPVPCAAQPPDAGPVPDAAPGTPVPDAGPDASPTPWPPGCGTEKHVVPAVRLSALAEQFPARYELESICQPDMSAMLSRIARSTGSVMAARPCLMGEVLDVGGEPGVQPSCRVFDVIGSRTDDEQRTELPACGPGVTGSCFRLEPRTDMCSHTPTQVAVVVERDGPAPAGAHLVAECRIR